MIRVDVNINCVTTVPVDILLANKFCVLIAYCAEEPPAPSVVDIVEIPSAKIEYRVEFVEAIDVLTLEKYDK